MSKSYFLHHFQKEEEDSLLRNFAKFCQENLQTLKIIILSHGLPPQLTK